MNTRILQHPSRRRELPARPKPYYAPTGEPGVSIGYRSLSDGRAGTWTVRVSKGRDQSATTERLGLADDYEPANGASVLTFAQAADLAKAKKRGHSSRPVTVIEAVREYAVELQRQGKNPYNIIRFEKLIPEWLGSLVLAKATAEHFAKFRNGLAMAPGTLKRTLKPLKAALSHAAAIYGIENVNPWKLGLKVEAIDGHREFIRLESNEDETAKIFAIIDAAYARFADDPHFGAFLQTLAETGLRPSQVAAIRVRDLHGEQITVPSSRKGKGNKPFRSITAHISAELAARLRLIAADRDGDDFLLARRKSIYQRRMKALAAELGVDWSLYFLRHATVSRMIAEGDKIADIAAQLDTGIKPIERHYYAENARVARKLLTRPTANVITLPRSA